MKKLLKRLNTHWQVWRILASNVLQQTFVNRWSNLLFFTGKIIRLAMSLLVLFLLKNTIETFAGYSTDEMIIFFLTYQFIDVLAQTFFRGVYMFTNQVRRGEFDFLLAKPVNTLFQTLTGHPDFNDAVFIIPTTILSVGIALQLDLTITTASLAWYLILLVNAFLIAAALHIIILSVGILTTEIDGATWLYRDLMDMARFPVTIYMEPLRFALFFLVPVGMMITIPSQVLINQPPTYTGILASLFGLGFFVFSLWLWNWSLKRYSSASS